MKTVLIVLFALVMSGCATALSGTTQTIHVESTPEGADVWYGGEVVGQTPLDFEADRDGDTTFTIKKEGFLPKTIFMDKSINRETHGNAAGLALYFVADAVDTLSGAKYKYDNDNYKISLIEVGND